MRAMRDDRDRGAGLVEYALLIALVALVAVGAIGFAGSRADATLSNDQLAGLSGPDTTTTDSPAATTTTEAPKATTTTEAPKATTTTTPKTTPTTKCKGKKC